MRRAGNRRAVAASRVGNNGANTKEGLARGIGSSHVLFRFVRCCRK